MKMRDLIIEQLHIIRRNVGPENVEEFISNHIDFADMERLNPGTIQAHGYLEGVADTMDMTVLELIDELGIDPNHLEPERRIRPPQAHRVLPAAIPQRPESPMRRRRH